MNEIKIKKHFIGLDILKVLTLFAISILHANEFIFFEDEFPLGWESPIWSICSYYARFFALGGQILVAIIYFLFGYNQKSKTQLFKISIFAILGQMLLGFIFKTIEWDIYLFIFFTNIIITQIPFFFNRNYFSLILSVLFLLLNPSYLQSFFDHYSPLSLLSGNYYLSQSGSWPLLPWFFLALFFFQAGKWVKESDSLQNWNSYESYLWPTLFILSIPNLGKYYNLPIGPNFYHAAFQESSVVFFSNFIFFIFMGRISLLEKTQHFLEKKILSKILSRSIWNRKLGLSYLISIFYLGFGMNYKQFFFDYPKLFDAFFIGIMPITEILSRLLIYLHKKALKR